MHPLQDNLHTLICRSMNPGVALQVSKLEKKKRFSYKCVVLDYIIDDSNKNRYYKNVLSCETSEGSQA